MLNSVASVYLHVMEDVIDGIRGDFREENLDESVLQDLMALWGRKLMEKGTIHPREVPENFGGLAPIPPPDLNVTYQSLDGFTPTHEMLFSPYATPTPGRDQTPHDDQAGRNIAIDMNIAYQEVHDEEAISLGQAAVPKDYLSLSSKRKRDEPLANYYPTYIPQQDGPSDVRLEIALTPQRDAQVNTYEDPVEEEDYNETGDQEIQHTQQAQNVTQTDVGGSDEEPPLNEDDDEDDEDVLDMDAAENSNIPLVIAQFEKVTRSKAKWKCLLKDGIMHMNNREILFSKATGDFNFLRD